MQDGRWQMADRRVQRGDASDPLECGDLSPLSPAAEPLSYFFYFDERRRAVTQGKKEAPPKEESGSATGESCDKSQHSKSAASPLFKT